MVTDVKTTKPISTISYNSTPFLLNKLEELIRSKHITFYAFIKHLSEDDEAGKKDHIHLYIEPSKMIQTDDLRAHFKQFVSADEKPLGVLPFQSSKFDDWCMYALHDERYLTAKKQSRRHHYQLAHIQCSDEDYFTFKYRQIDMTALTPYEAMLEAQNLGLSWEEYFAQGIIPLPQLALYKVAWDTLLRAETFRNGRKGHSDVIDTETGEVIE